MISLLLLLIIATTAITILTLIQNDMIDATTVVTRSSVPFFPFLSELAFLQVLGRRLGYFIFSLMTLIGDPTYEYF